MLSPLSSLSSQPRSVTTLTGVKWIGKDSGKMVHRNPEWVKHMDERGHIVAKREWLHDGWRTALRRQLVI